MTAKPEGFALSGDVLVLGGGPAGAWAAIAAAERGASAVLADKGRVGTSGATAAANTAVIDVAPGSAARRQVIERSLERGLGLAQAEWIERMVDETHARLSQFADWGYAFARDDRGAVYRGSLRGPDYMQLLRRHLHKAGIRLLDHSPAFKLLLSYGEVVGAEGLGRAGAPWTVYSGAVVVATGGCAFMSRALGTYELTGDGLLMTVEAGAALSGMKFSGQYGISHLHATVTKTLIYDWATFSDESGCELDGGDVFEIVAATCCSAPFMRSSTRSHPRSRKDCVATSPTFFFLLTGWGSIPSGSAFQSRCATRARSAASAASRSTGIAPRPSQACSPRATLRRANSSSAR